MNAMTRTPKSKVAMQHALDGARYAFHRVVRQKYAHAVQRGEISADQGEEMYKAAMNNYADIINACAAGRHAEGNARQMAEDIAKHYSTYLSDADDRPLNTFKWGMVPLEGRGDV